MLKDKKRRGLEEKRGEGRRRQRRGRRRGIGREKRGRELFFQKIFENKRKEIRMVGDMFEIQDYVIRY